MLIKKRSKQSICMKDIRGRQKNLDVYVLIAFIKLNNQNAQISNTLLQTLYWLFLDQQN